MDETSPFSAGETTEESQNGSAENVSPDESLFRSLSREEMDRAFEFYTEVSEAYQIEDPSMAGLMAIMIRLRRLEERQLGVLTEIRDQRQPDSRGKFPTEMSHDIPPESPPTDPYQVERTPLEQGWARITAISFAWPDGAGNAVGIRIRTESGLTLFPRNPEDNYVAFNDFSETFPFDYTLRPGETLVAETINLDDTYSHFVNIVPHIEEVREEVGRMRREEQTEIFDVDGDDDGGDN